jgi:hypothetical protein
LRLGYAYKGGTFRGEGATKMRFSRLLLVVVAALPLCACFMTAEEIAANDDARCRSAGLKPGTPAYAKCREDIRNRRAMSDMAMRIGAQNQIWSMQEMNTQMMMRQH